MVSSTSQRAASRVIPSDWSLSADSLALGQEPEQEMLGADEAVIEQARLFLRKH
jgi:hypothetical protein